MGEHVPKAGLSVHKLVCKAPRGQSRRQDEKRGSLEAGANLSSHCHILAWNSRDSKKSEFESVLPGCYEGILGMRKEHI